MVRLEASSRFTQDVKDARAWAFLLDAEGLGGRQSSAGVFRVVGN
jgi:hypothetical protein